MVGRARKWYAANRCWQKTCQLSSSFHLTRRDERPVQGLNSQAFHVLRRCLLLFAMIISACGPSHATRRAPLWPDGAPGAQGEDYGDRPELFYFLPPPDLQVGTAIIVAAGGSYGHQLALHSEGFKTARWLQGQGITAVVVRYRVGQSGYNHQHFIADGRRAVRTVRAQSGELGIQPTRIGMMGFSAGGHLAASVAVQCADDRGRPGASDPIERESCALWFATPVYPVVTMGDQYAHRRSRNNLLRGIDQPSEKLIEKLSVETQVTSDTPPMFIVTTRRDRKVPWQNSMLLYDALLARGVRAKLLLFEDGAHGVGIADARRKMPRMSTWPTQFLRWIERFPKTATERKQPHFYLGGSAERQPVWRSRIAAKWKVDGGV